MSIASQLSIVALVVASLSFLLSAAVLYTQHASRSRLSAVLGDWVRLYYTPNGEVVTVLSVSFLNDGTDFGAVYRLAGRLRSMSDATSANLNLTSFLAVDRVEATDHKVSVHQRFAGLPETIVLPAKSALTKTVQLVSDAPFVLREGRHELEIAVFSEPEAADVPIVRTAFVLQYEDVAQLPSAGAVSATSVTMSLVAPLRHL